MPRWKRAFGRSRRAPEDADSALRGALLHVLDRELEDAERLIESACHLDSKSVEPYLALAKLYRMRGEIGRAIRVHQNLLLRKDLAPAQTVTALADLAADFRRGGFLQRAIAAYEEVLVHDPKHREALIALVWLLSDARDHARAIEMARRLAKLDADAVRRAPSEAALLVDAAEASLAQGRGEEARRSVKRALRRDPRSVKAWIALGEIEAERGRQRAALSAWMKVPALDRRAASAVYPRLQATSAALGREGELEKRLRGWVEERPDDPHARIALARMLAERGDGAAAKAQLQTLLERDPDDLAARAALGRVLLSEGGEGETTRAYGELLDVLERQGLLQRAESLR